MMKKFIVGFVYIALIFIFLLNLGACSSTITDKKYSSSFFDTFDTLVTVYGYAESQERFDEFLSRVHTRFVELHQLFDAYNTYEGINNIKTINDGAGGQPVAVKRDITKMLTRSVELYNRTGGKTNVAMGAVLNVWAKYRDFATANPDTARLPDEKELQMAAQHMDIEDLVIDSEKNTVTLKDPLMSLDVGAVGKGYACETVKQEMIDAGFDHFVISAGGNVVTVGRDLENDAPWSIGIQAPDAQTGGTVVDMIKVSNLSVVTAGSYQRYFTVDGVRYNHIIDPETLMPSAYFDSVTVICEDSTLADFMATTLFMLPYEEGVALAERMGELVVFWIDCDGKHLYTDNYSEFSSLY